MNPQPTSTPSKPSSTKKKSKDMKILRLEISPEEYKNMTVLGSFPRSYLKQQ